MNEISIVVPMYNAENLIRRCVDSILNQTFEQFELILVDDGSTDNTAAICKEYTENDSRISYLHQDNAGPDIARQTGVNAAKGSFLMFADADDYVASDLLQILYDEAKTTGSDLICSRTVRFNNNGKKWEDKTFPQEAIDCEEMEKRFYHFFASRYITGAYYAKLIKKDLLGNYSFMKESVIGEDVTAVIYLLLHAKKVRVINKGCYYYYWNLDSISHSGYTKRHKLSLLNYIKVKENLIEHNSIDKMMIAGFFAEYEMAVATAMSRNWSFEQSTIDILQKDLKRYKHDILKNQYTSFYMKVCIHMFIYCPKLFFILYRVVFLLTGR